MYLFAGKDSVDIVLLAVFISEESIVPKMWLQVVRNNKPRNILVVMLGWVICL